MDHGLRVDLLDRPEIGRVVRPEELVRGALSGRMILAGVTTTQGVLVEAKETWEVPTRLIANSIAGMVNGKVVVLMPSVGGKPEITDYFKLFDYDIALLIKAFEETK